MSRYAAGAKHRAVELYLAKVESIGVEQMALGLLLRHGAGTVVGTDLAPEATASAWRGRRRKGRAMQHKHLQFGHGFRVVLGDGHSQAAQMTLAPGEAEGGPDNHHRGADQWLYVVSGTGLAVVNGKRVGLREGTLLLIRRGDRHEIRNTGPGPLKTVNVYVPPAYTEDGEELPAGKVLVPTRRPQRQALASTDRL